MQKVFLIHRDYFSNCNLKGHLYSLFSEELLSDSIITEIRSLATEIKPPEIGYPVIPEEIERELCFWGVSRARFETNLYFKESVKKDVFQKFFELIPLNKRNRVLSEKIRHHFYRRTFEVNNSIIVKEFSGGPMAEVFFLRTLKFLQEGPYKERLISFKMDKDSHYYNVSYEKILGLCSMYDFVFKNNLDIQKIYTRYFELVKRCWPFVHLDLHGDNILVTEESLTSPWDVIDFESFVQMPAEQAFVLYHGLFIQTIGHSRSHPYFKTMNLEEFKDFLGISYE